ncbi:MAG: 23S rRNA (adenine(2503)-C(2))-methyltransferase RlmN [Armatimonadota bacterium]
MSNNFEYLAGLSTKELEEYAESHKQSKFRGRQIASWIYKKDAGEISDMSDLPASFRSEIKETTRIHCSSIASSVTSSDGTTKYLLEMSDAQRIEAVLLPYEDRVSVCVSTQIGCAAGCVFCATGMCGFTRNLSVCEIVDEVLLLQKEGNRRVSHVVYMGMGEPLLNYDNVLKSIHILNDEVGIAMRHITLSTVGITPRISKLAEEKLQLTLAVSLHAPTDVLRRKLVPLSERYPINGLMAACRHYANVTHRQVTIEYLLIDGVNDSPQLALELASLLKGMLCSVNLIPYNIVEGLDYRRPSRERIKAFRAVLEEKGIVVTQRMERGHSVSAACGQLRRRDQSGR